MPLTEGNTPSYLRELEGQERRVILDYETLRERASVATYAGSSKTWGGTLRHDFTTRGGSSRGLPFRLWGCADLNRKLSGLNSGAVLVLCYLGLEPSEADRNVHGWRVLRVPASHIAAAMRDFAKGTAELEAIIRPQLASSSEGDQAPATADDDRGGDDLPF